MKRSTLNKLEDKVKRIFRFEHFVQFHCIFVIELSHNLNFLDEALLSIFFTISGLFGESFDSIKSVVLNFFYQVDRSKVSFPNFFYGFKLLVETFLIEIVFEVPFPLSLIAIEELQDDDIFLAIKLHFIFINKKSNFKHKRDVLLTQYDHF